MNGYLTTRLSSLHILLYTVVFSVCLLGIAWSQRGAERNDLFPLQAMPSDLHAHIRALGERVQRPGHERTVFAGTYTDSSGSRTITMTHQLPDVVRVVGNVGSAEAAVVETFAMDTPEGLLSAVRRGAAMRLLGRGFAPDSRSAADYKGSRYDIYEVTEPAPTRTAGQVRMRRYYFDTTTGLLLSTRYYDRAVSPPIAIETRISSWSTVAGSRYPARIERYENGRLIFSFVVNSVTGGPKQDAANFQNP